MVVVEAGGVGSRAAEAQARSGVGGFTLIDLDQIAESNVNRRVHAFESTLGAAKVDVLARRLRGNRAGRPDRGRGGSHRRGGDSTVVIEAIDAVIAKAALIAWYGSRTLPITPGGAAVAAAIP